jgi:hypothetical protein
MDVTAGQGFPVPKGFAWPAAATARHWSACNFQAKTYGFQKLHESIAEVSSSLQTD